MTVNKDSENEEIQELLAELLEAAERGDVIDREQLCSDYPQYADSICEFLENNGMVQEAMAVFRDAGAPPPVDSAFAPTVGSQVSDEPKRFDVGDSLQYVGEYEIIDEIARGGMGIVFKATQAGLRRVVALKMLLAGRLASETDVDRFHREARAAAALTHPNIVRVHEVGEHEGRHYFTMDFVEGESLASIISKETLSPKRTAELIKTVALAIDYAHRKGVLHRDLKPANILLDGNGDPHVTDFGLAKALGPETTNADLTSTGQVLGTPSYMSPEQASAKHQLIGVASDIYSLGAILYACVSGRGPFVADSAIDTIRQVIEKEPVSLRLLNPQVPKDLETICLKCLQKEPHRRYGTAGELAADVDRFRQGRAVEARPISNSRKLARWMRRNPTVASLAGLSVLLLITGIAVSTTFGILASERALSETRHRKRADAESAAAVVAREQMYASLKETQKAYGQAEAALHSAQWNVYKMQLYPMFDAWKRKQFGLLESMLQNAESANIPSEFRDWEFHLLRDAVGDRSTLINGETTGKIVRYNHQGQLLAIRRVDGSVEVCDADSLEVRRSFDSKNQIDIAWHPDQNLLAVADGKHRVKVWDVDTGKLLREWTTKNDSTAMDTRGVAWSPDGSTVALGGYRRVDLFDLDGGPSRTLDCPSWVRQLDWTADGTSLGVAGVSCIAAIDVKNNVVLWKHCRNKVNVYSIEWNPKGTVLAGGWGWPKYNITLYRRESGEVTQMMPVEQVVRSLAWSPDGNEIIAAGGNQRIDRWDPKTGEKKASLATHTTRIDWMDVNWDSLEAMTVNNEAKLRRVTLRDAPLFGRKVSVAPGKGRTWWMKYHPERPHLLAVGSSHRIHVVDARRGTVLNSFENPSRFGAFTWHPQRELLAAIDMRGNVIHWDALNGDELRHWKASSSSFTVTLQWSPDGERMLVGTGQRKSVESDFSFEVVDLNDFEDRIYLGNFGSRSAARFSPDGNRVAVHSWKSGRRLQVWDIDQQSLIAESDEIVGWHEFIEFGPNGQRIALGGEGGNFFVVDAATGEILKAQNTGAAQIRSVAWSPNGNRLLTSSDDRTVHLWDGRTLDLVTTLTDDFGPCADWNANGQQLATCTQDGVIRIWGGRFTSQ